MNLWLRAVLPIALIVGTGLAGAWLAAYGGTRRDRQRERARRDGTGRYSRG